MQGISSFAEELLILEVVCSRELINCSILIVSIKCLLLCKEVTMIWGLLLLCMSGNIVLFSIRVTKFLHWCG
jgi:hypothetical protein